MTASLPACGVALLPKCPLCLSIYFSGLGSAGLGLGPGAVRTTLLATLLISLTLTAVLTFRQRRFGLLLAVLTAALLILWGRYAGGSRPALLLGATLLLGTGAVAAVTAARSTREPAREPTSL